MKSIKKITAAMLTLAMLSTALTMSVFAATVTENDNLPKAQSNFKVSYNFTPEASPKFTVTIPAGVTLSDDAATDADITAEGVENLGGRKINVELTSGTNTNEGSTFHAKNGDSVVTYTISKGSDTISVGDKVAVFESNGSQKLTFSQPDKTDANVEGEHTENLTFTVSLTDAAVTAVNLNKARTEITVGKSETLTATVTPANASNPTVTWSSSDNTVATVDSTGKVTGVKTGTATITATAGGKSAACEVTIIAVQPTIDVGSLTIVGPGNGNFLNGKQWDATAEENMLTKVEENVYQITFENVEANKKYTFQFILNGVLDHYFKGIGNPCNVSVNADKEQITTVELIGEFGDDPCDNVNLTPVSSSDYVDITLTVDFSDYSKTTYRGTVLYIDVTPHN